MVSAREIEGGGHNRLIGPDFHWKHQRRPTALRAVPAQQHGEPEPPRSERAVRRAVQHGHAYRVVLRARREDATTSKCRHAGIFAGVPRRQRIRGAERLPPLQVSGPGCAYYPKNFFSYVRPYTASSTTRPSTALRDAASDVFYQGFEFQGRWGSSGWMDGRISATSGSARKLLTRRFSSTSTCARRRDAGCRRCSSTARSGERIDYAGGRVGKGARLNLSGTTRLNDHLEMQLRTSREWLDLDGGRLFNAQIDWLKTTYTFSPRSLVRAIAQQSTIEREGSPRDRTLLPLRPLRLQAQLADRLLRRLRRLQHHRRDRRR